MSGPSSLTGGLTSSQGTLPDSAQSAMLAAQTAFLSGGVGQSGLVPGSPSITPPTSAPGGAGACSGAGAGLSGLSSLLTSAPHPSLLQSPPASGGPSLHVGVSAQSVSPSSFAAAAAIAAPGSQQGQFPTCVTSNFYSKQSFLL